MKHLLVLSLWSLASLVHASADWKVVATVSDPACVEKIQILAKEGESFVFAVDGDNKSKLMAEDGSAFSADSMKSTIYSSDAKQKNLGAATYAFIQPSYVEANPPKLDISHHGVKKHCRMNLQ